jgi:hypothetical protein
MTTRGGTKRVYSLNSASQPNLPFTRSHSESVIEAGDVGNTIRTPALYVRVTSSGNKVTKTTIIRSLAPTWEHACPMYVSVVSPVSILTCVFRTAELSSVLFLHLKHSRKWGSPILLGSVNITIQELLDRCRNTQRELSSLLMSRNTVSPWLQELP